MQQQVAQEHITINTLSLNGKKGKGVGKYGYQNRTWQRFDFASALRDAMIEAGVPADFAKEVIEKSYDLDGAIKYFADNFKDEAIKESKAQSDDDILDILGIESDNKEKLAHLIPQYKELESKYPDASIWLRGEEGVYTKGKVVGKTKDLVAVNEAIKESKTIKESVDEEELDALFEDEMLDTVRDHVYSDLELAETLVKKLGYKGLDFKEAVEYLIETMKTFYFDEAEGISLRGRKGYEDEEDDIDEEIYTLHPQHDARQSFYGKARVDVSPDGKTKTLISYNTKVARIVDGKVELLYDWDSSQTTLRHVKEFLKQNGFKAETSKQIAKDYNIEESLEEAKELQSSPYKDLIGKHFEYSQDFDFLDIVAIALNRN